MKNCTWELTTTGYAGAWGTSTRRGSDKRVDSANASAIGSRPASVCSIGGALITGVTSTVGRSAELASPVVGSPSDAGEDIAKEYSRLSDSAAAGAKAPDAKTMEKTVEMPKKR